MNLATLLPPSSHQPATAASLYTHTHTSVKAVKRTNYAKTKTTAANDLRLKEDRLRRGARREGEGRGGGGRWCKGGTQHFGGGNLLAISLLINQASAELS